MISKQEAEKSVNAEDEELFMKTEAEIDRQILKRSPPISVTPPYPLNAKVIRRLQEAYKAGGWQLQVRDDQREGQWLELS